MTMSWPVKVRLPADCRWVKKEGHPLAPKLHLSDEFKNFVLENNIQYYRWQSHRNFITVIFHNALDAEWFLLTI
jgi:hypothetical protein